MTIGASSILYLGKTPSLLRVTADVNVLVGANRRSDSFKAKVGARLKASSISEVMNSFHHGNATPG
jgi:hypothetical protein